MLFVDRMGDLTVHGHGCSPWFGDIPLSGISEVEPMNGWRDERVCVIAQSSTITSRSLYLYYSSLYWKVKWLPNSEELCPCLVNQNHLLSSYQKKTFNMYQIAGESFASAALSIPLLCADSPLGWHVETNTLACSHSYLQAIWSSLESTQRACLWNEERSHRAWRKTCGGRGRTCPTKRLMFENTTRSKAKWRLGH